MNNLYRQFTLKGAAAILCIFLFHSSLFAQRTRQGVVRIKVNEALATQLESRTFTQNASGDVITGVASLDQRNRQFKVRRFTRVFPYAGRNEAKHRKYGLHLWYTVAMDDAIPVSQMIQSYQSDKQILKVEPVYEKAIVGSTGRSFGPITIDAPTRAPLPLPDASNDPLLGTQWHYNNTGQTGGTPGADIRLFDAWKNETGNSNVIIAVTDGGIQLNHPDLAANLWTNAGEVASNGIDDDNNGYIDDIHGYGFVNKSRNIVPDDHGTHVAGTIAAVNNNGIGVAGVAGGSGYGDGVRLMSCAVFNQDAADGFAAAYVYSADNGAIISQNSWGYTQPDVFEQVVLDAIDYFIAEAGQNANGVQTGPMNGGLVIFSAGNSNEEGQYYPAAYEPVLAVASTNHKDIKALYSNFGAWVDIAAPGGETYEHDAEGVVSTLTGSRYGAFMGTSMACPHVSGVAGLILSRFGKEGLTPDALRKKLLQSVDNIDSLNPVYAGKLGSGRLNAALALAEGDNLPPEAVTDLHVSETEVGAITVSWTSPRDNSGVIAGYDLRYSTAPITAANFNDAIPAANTPAPQKPGATEYFTFTPLSGSVLFYFALRAIDFAGNVSALSNVVQQTSADAPAIVVAPTAITASLKTAAQGTADFAIRNEGKGPLSFTILEPDDESPFATITPLDGTVQPGETTAITVALSADALVAGTYRRDIVIEHNDPDTGNVIVPLTLEVTDNGSAIATASPVDIDFRSATIGTTAKQSLQIGNAGSEDLIITDIRSSTPAFHSPAAMPITVRPFQKVDVTLYFSPASVGVIAGTLSIHTNDPAHSILEVSVRGEGLRESPIAVTPAAFSETIPAGSKSVRTMVVQNNGSQDRTFSLSVINNGLANMAEGANATARDRGSLADDSLRARQQRLLRQHRERLESRPRRDKAWAEAVRLPEVQHRPANGRNARLQSATESAHVYTTGFENFPAGPLAEEGWTTTPAWTVTTDNADSGNRHLRGTNEMGGTTENSALSPYIVAYDELFYPHYTTTKMRLNLDEGNGAPWEIVPQDPWSYVATRIRFNPDGSIEAMVIDNDYAFHWKPVPVTTPSGYFDLAIEYNNWGSDTSSFPTYHLFINNEKVFSGTGLAPGIGQVAFIGATETAGPIFDLDNFALHCGEYIPAYLKPTPLGGTIPAGQSVNVDLVFDASAMKYGSYEADLLLQFDGVDSLLVPTELTVTGLPSLITDLTALDLDLYKGETATRRMTLTNTGGSSVQFKLAEKIAMQGLTLTPASGTIPVRGEQVVNIEFTAPPGLYENEILLTTDIPGGTPQTIPVEITVFETATLFSAPDQVKFQIPAGDVSTRTVTLRNDGKNAVSFRVETAGEHPWISVAPEKASIAPPSLDLQLTFDATEISAGTYTSVVTFTTNDMSRPRHALNITLEVMPDASGTGSISWEKWSNIPGTNLSDIPVTSAPSASGLLPGFASESNSGDQYGQRIRGFIHPPANGYYTFFIASNDNSTLWLSTDEREGNKRMIASVSGYTNPLQWDKYPSQTSAAIYLEANRKYYIEALHKEGVGSDHLAVGWRLPDGVMEMPVPGVRLSPFEPSPLCSASGLISREYWMDVGGSEITDIPLNRAPDGVETLTSFEGPVNVGSRYADRIRGYICAPATGDYYFWIASNDHSELWLSTDDDPAHKVRIAWVSGATGIRQWDKFASQQSVAIPLKKGKTYYIEALHKQGVGSDHLAVGWQLPDGTLERPMHGDYLSPFLPATSGGQAVARSEFKDMEAGLRADVYPNPVHGGNLSIAIDHATAAESAFADIEIRQLTGMAVYTKRVDCAEGCNVQIPVQENFTPGVYILQLRAGGEVFIEKVIVGD